jgi:hypothetical protein
MIEVASANRNFRVQGSLLTTADGTKLVRYFGRDREVIVPRTVEILGKSCFESNNYFDMIVFEPGSKLRQIGPLAFSGCEFLRSIAIPASVEIIGDFGFNECDGLEECLMAEDAILVKLGKESFADCRSLRSFCCPKSIREIDESCFMRCGPLHLLIFESGRSLRTIIGDVAFYEWLEHIGFADTPSLLKIEVNEDGADLDFPGWISVRDNDSTHVLIQASK